MSLWVAGLRFWKSCLGLLIGAFRKFLHCIFIYSDMEPQLRELSDGSLRRLLAREIAEPSIPQKQKERKKLSRPLRMENAET